MKKIRTISIILIIILVLIMIINPFSKEYYSFKTFVKVESNGKIAEKSTRNSFRSQLEKIGLEKEVISSNSSTVMISLNKLELMKILINSKTKKYYSSYSKRETAQIDNERMYEDYSAS